MLAFLGIFLHLLLFHFAYRPVVSQSTADDTSPNGGAGLIIAFAYFNCSDGNGNLSDRPALEQSSCTVPFLTDMACRYGTTVKNLTTAYNDRVHTSAFAPDPDPAPAEVYIGNEIFHKVDNSTYQACLCHGDAFWKAMQGCQDCVASQNITAKTGLITPDLLTEVKKDFCGKDANQDLINDYIVPATQGNLSAVLAQKTKPATSSVATKNTTTTSTTTSSTATSHTSEGTALYTSSGILPQIVTVLVFQAFIGFLLHVTF